MHLVLYRQEMSGPLWLNGHPILPCRINVQGKVILSLISHDKSANSTNQTDLYNYIFEREGVVKHIAMYFECRFTKLGYSAASILESLPFLRMLLN